MRIFLLMGLILTTAMSHILIRVTTDDLELVRDLARSNLQFTFDIFKILSVRNDAIMSPLSIGAALSMLASGSTGETLNELQEFLNLKKFSTQEEIDQTYLLVMFYLYHFNSNHTLSTAKILLLCDNYTLNNSFYKKARNNYGFYIESVNFRQKGKIVANAIDRWVAQQTNFKIEKATYGLNLDAFKANSILVDANYFKWIWKFKFKPEDTKIEKFYLADGNEKLVSMMSLENSFNYLDMPQLDCQIVELKYAGDRMVMLIFLPNSVQGQSELKLQLKPEVFNLIIQQMTDKQSIRLKLPKFDLKYQVLLNGYLNTLYLKEIFSKFTAELPGISRMEAENLHISQFLHITRVVIGEEGVEKVPPLIPPNSLSDSNEDEAPTPTPQPVQFTVDHPFTFIIYDTFTNFTLFIGSVDDPVPLQIPNLN